MDRISQVLLSCLAAQPISDFHLHAGKKLRVRLSGEIVEQAEIFEKQEIESFIEQGLGPAGWQEFRQSGDADFAHLADGQRFRANAYQMIGGPALALRVIPSEIPQLDRLGLPEAVHQVLGHRHGLVLVTGQTGSGKSTSLAAMIDAINQRESGHIITIEDPIEFVHQDKSCLISQREAGRDTSSFASALKAALRQDPDVILMGELRDLETVSMALTAAETGHLVLATLHTNGAPDTVNRVIDLFPAGQQEQARGQLAASLLLVLTQQLLPAAGGGRIAAFEVMTGTPAVANLIREGKTAQLASILQTGHQDGMITMQKYLEQLHKAGKISQSAGPAPPASG